MITSINRAWAFNPGIVTISSTDTVLECLSPNYLTSQADVISLLNKGSFEFRFGDLIALSASDSSEFCKFVGTDFSTLILSEGPGGGTGIISTNFLNGPTPGESFPIPDGTIYFYFELCAGGGGGGGAVDGGGANTFAAGGGGGAGGFTRGYYINNYNFITGTIDYIVGFGGAGGVGAGNGADGQTSSFFVPSVAFSRSTGGGKGGLGSTGLSATSTSFVAGGNGGGASGGPALGGGYGFPGSINAGAVCSGAGGSTVTGNGGGCVIADGNGIIGNGSGCGGSGAARTTSGSSNGAEGNPGFLYVTFFGLVL